MIAPKILVAIKSCLRDLDLGFHDIIKSTWGADLAGKADLRFFTGEDTRPREQGHIMLHVADDYNSLAKKTRHICRWMSGKVYDYIFLADTDTYVSVRKLLSSGFEPYDYAGKIDRSYSETFAYTAINRDGELEHHISCYPWASGGYGYMLSRRAAIKVADSEHISYAEDLTVGNVLGPSIRSGEMLALHIPGDTISWHHPEHGEIYTKEKMATWMNKMHKENR